MRGSESEIGIRDQNPGTDPYFDRDRDPVPTISDFPPVPVEIKGSGIGAIGFDHFTRGTRGIIL